MKLIASILSALLLATALQACGGGGGSDIDIPASAQRSDLQYGFYGKWGNVGVETKDFTNLDWDLLREETPEVIENMKATGHATVIDIDKLIFAGGNPRQLKTNREQNLREFFNALRAAGVLQQVDYLVPCDEPNLRWDGTAELLPQVLELTRRIAAEYPELNGVQIGVIYAGNRAMPYIELFDIAGFDDYDAKSGIFAPGAGYDQMRALMRPEQRTWIVAGGYQGQDPTPFLNFANSHPEVAAIIGFLWVGPKDEGFTAPGIRDIPAMRLAYTAAGQKIVNASK